MRMSRYFEISEKFKEFLKTYADEKSQTELASMFDVTQSTISRVLKGDMLPTEAILKNMQDKWGVDFSAEVEKARKDGSRVANRGTRLPKKNFSTGVPYYDVDFVGGFDLLANDQTVNPDYLIDFKPFEKATCWCNITGHSMEPEITHGDIIALRKIEDWSYLPFGEIYAIVTRNDMRTVKRLGPGTTKDTFMLIPANKSPEYAPQEINKRDILHVFEVMGCMKRF